MKNLKISLGLIILCIFSLSIFNCSDSGKNLNDIWVSVDKNNVTTTILDMKDKEILRSTSFILGVLIEDEHKYTIEKTGDIFVLKSEKGKFSSYNGNIKFVNDTMFTFDDSIKYYKCPEYSELISGLYNFYVNSTKVDLYIDVNNANNLVFSNKGQKNEKKFSITGNVLSIIEESGKNMNFLILDETHMAAIINPLEGGIVFEAVKEGSHPYGLQSSFGNLQEERSYDNEDISTLNNLFSQWQSYMKDKSISIMNLYSDPINYYYQGMKPKSKVTSDKMSFFKKWDYFDMSISNVSKEKISPSKYKFTFDNQFSVSSNASGKSMDAKTRNHLIFEKIDGTWLITEEIEEEQYYINKNK